MQGQMGGLGSLGGGQMQPWGAAQPGTFNGATPAAFGSVNRTYPQGGGMQPNWQQMAGGGGQRNVTGNPGEQGGMGVPMQGGQPMPGWAVPYREGWNNWRMMPQGGLNSTPGPISQQNYNYLNKRENVLQNRVQGYRGALNQGADWASQRGLNFLKGKLGDLRGYQKLRGAPGAGGTTGAPAVDPVTGQPTTPAVDPVTGEPVDTNGTGYATDVYGHYSTGAGGDGTDAGAGASAYDPNMDPRTFGMPSSRAHDRGRQAMLQYKNQLLNSGTPGQGDPRMMAMQDRQRQINNRLGAGRDQARDANMQTLLAAQTAGTTLSPEQLAWLTKMQGRQNAG